MADLVDLIVSNGMSVVIIAYLLFSDYKFNENLSKTLETINQSLEIIKSKIGGEYND